MKISVRIILAIGRNETVFGTVKTVEQPLVKRQSGPQNSCQDRLLFQYPHLGNAQRCGNLFLFVWEFLADFVGENLSYPFQVFPETHGVLLYYIVANFSQVLVEDGVAVTEYVYH